MALMHEVLGGRKLHVHALRLEDDTDASAHLVWLHHGIKAENARASAAWDHERAQYAEKRGFAAAIRSKKSKNFRGPNVKGDAVQRDAIVIAVPQRLNLNSGGVACSALQKIFRRAGEDFGIHAGTHRIGVKFALIIISANSSGR